MKKQRPTHLNLLKIKLPISGVVSILHRLSGVLLFLALPFILNSFQLSLASENGFNNTFNTNNYGVLLKLFIIVVLWAGILHLMAGIRFLLLDAHWGISLSRSRFSARLIMFLSALSAFAVGGWLW